MGDRGRRCDADDAGAFPKYARHGLDARTRLLGDAREFLRLLAQPVGRGVEKGGGVLALLAQLRRALAKGRAHGLDALGRALGRGGDALAFAPHDGVQVGELAKGAGRGVEDLLGLLVQDARRVGDVVAAARADLGHGLGLVAQKFGGGANLAGGLLRRVLQLLVALAKRFDHAFDAAVGGFGLAVHLARALAEKGCGIEKLPIGLFRRRRQRFGAFGQAVAAFVHVAGGGFVLGGEVAGPVAEDVAQGVQAARGVFTETGELGEAVPDLARQLSDLVGALVDLREAGAERPGGGDDADDAAFGGGGDVLGPAAKRRGQGVESYGGLFRGGSGFQGPVAKRRDDLGQAAARFLGRAQHVLLARPKRVARRAQPGHRVAGCAAELGRAGLDKLAHPFGAVHGLVGAGGQLPVRLAQKLAQPPDPVGGAFGLLVDCFGLAHELFARGLDAKQRLFGHRLQGAHLVA